MFQWTNGPHAAADHADHDDRDTFSARGKLRHQRARRRWSMVVALLPQYANLGSPIWHTTGCDTATDTVCRVLMNGDKRVTIAVGAL